MFDLLDIQREINNRSFYEFVKYFWQDIDTSEYIDNWHIEYLCSIMQEAFEKWQRKENAIDIIINIPPGTSKTMICSKLFNSWVWTIEPKVKFITCSYSDNISKSNGMKTRDLISSDRFKQMYKLKLKKDNNNKSEFENTKGGYRLSLGISGSLTGRHGDFIIFDDPENPKMAHSEAHREQSKQGLKTLSTRKTDKLRSITIVIQQRLSFADVTSVLLAREKEYKHICLPAILTDDINPEHIKERYINGYLDTIRLNEEALNNNKIDLGIDAYFCQFLQAPANEKNGIFKKEWFNYYKEIEYKECFIFVDTAQKTKEKNDYSAFGVFTVVNDNLYLLEMVQKKLEYPDALKEILSLNAKYNPRAIYIEDKSSGTSLIQDIKRTYRLPIREIPRTTDKVLRANQVSAKVEAGYCYIRENQVDFLMQAIKFPDVKNDDMVDVFIDAVNILIMKNNNKLNKVNVQMW